MHTRSVVLSIMLFVARACCPQTSADTTLGRLLGEQKINMVVTSVLHEKVGSYNAAAPKGRKVEYTSEFTDVVSGRVAQVKVSTEINASNAEGWLRDGFGTFVVNFLEFAAKKVEDRVVQLNQTLFESYMNRQRQDGKCGEIPCNQPPCCRNCIPPPCKSGTSRTEAACSIKNEKG